MLVNNGTKGFINWAAPNTFVAGTALTTGTMVIGGVTFPWKSKYGGTSASGGTLSASSTSFTY